MADESAEKAPRFKLLVPTNFSHKSDLALKFALQYSHLQAQAAEVFLFHSYDQRNVDYRQLDEINQACVERMKAAVLRGIEALGKQGMTHTVEMVHRRLSYGNPGPEILRMSAGMGADMILMGAPRSSHFRRLIEKAPCTLVLVKDKDPTFVMD